MDSAYRIVNESGKIHSNIFDLAITHIYGCRPYSYGLQACNATSAIVINSWLSSAIPNHSKVSTSTITEIYKADETL